MVGETRKMSTFRISWVAGEKETEGSFCEISPAFRSAASDVTSNSASRMRSSANRDAFCEAALWRVAIFRGRLVGFFAVRELLGPCSAFEEIFEDAVVVEILLGRGTLTVSKDWRPPGDNG